MAALETRKDIESGSSAGPLLKLSQELQNVR